MRSTKSKIAIFIIANILTATLLNFLLAAPSRIRILMKEFQQEKYSTIILGQSHVASSINPFLLDEGPDDRAFNFARFQTPYRNFYYTIVEANEKNKLKRVIYEIDSVYLCDIGLDKQLGIGNSILSYLSPKLQLDYLWNVMFRQDYNQALFDYNLAVTQGKIQNIKRNIEIKSSRNYLNAVDPEAKNEPHGDNYQYQGRGFIRELSKNKVECKFSQFKAENVEPTALAYLQKSADYCKKNDIELICVISALPLYRLENENHDEVHDYIFEVCEQNGIKFIDCNYIKWQYFNRTDDDYIDAEGHMLGHLADRQTKILKEIIDSTEYDKYFENSYQDVLKGLQERKN